MQNKSNELKNAASAMGRKGGAARSAAKAAAVRENGKLGGRPVEVEMVFSVQTDADRAMPGGRDLAGAVGTLRVAQRDARNLAEYLEQNGLPAADASAPHKITDLLHPETDAQLRLASLNHRFLLAMKYRSRIVEAALAAPMSRESRGQFVRGHGITLVYASGRKTTIR